MPKSRVCAIVGGSSVLQAYWQTLKTFSNLECRYVVSERNDLGGVIGQNEVKKVVVTNLDRVFDDAEVDSVFIINEPAKHLKIAIQALRNNIDVLVEKPLTNRYCLKDRKQLEELAELRSDGIAVVAQMRFCPLLRALKKKLSLRDPLWGVITIAMPRTTKYYESGNGWRLTDSDILANQAYHYLDILMWLFGKPVSFDCFNGSFHKISSVVDTSLGILRFANGSVISVNASSFASRNTSDIELFSKDYVWSYGKERRKTLLLKIAEEVVSFRQSRWNLRRTMIENFLWPKGDPERLMCSVDEAFDVVDLSLAMSGRSAMSENSLKSNHIT